MSIFYLVWSHFCSLMTFLISFWFSWNALMMFFFLIRFSRFKSSSLCHFRNKHRNIQKVQRSYWVEFLFKTFFIFQKATITHQWNLSDMTTKDWVTFWPIIMVNVISVNKWWTLKKKNCMNHDKWPSKNIIEIPANKNQGICI